MRNLVYMSQVTRVIENAYLPFGWFISEGRQQMIREALINAIIELEWTNYNDLVPRARQIVVDIKPGTRITKCSRCGVERRNDGKSNFCRDCGAKFDLAEVDEV